MYLLDTSICIYIIKKKYESLLKKIVNEEPYGIAISSITAAESEYGIAKFYTQIEIEKLSLNFFLPLK